MQFITSSTSDKENRIFNYKLVPQTSLRPHHQCSSEQTPCDWTRLLVFTILPLNCVGIRMNTSHFNMGRARKSTRNSADIETEKRVWINTSRRNDHGIWSDSWDSTADIHSETIERIQDVPALISFKKVFLGGIKRLMTLYSRNWALCAVGLVTDTLFDSLSCSQAKWETIYCIDAKISFLGFCLN